MNTNIPQDVIELAKQAGFDVDDDGDIWGSENGSLLRFAELLRAQRLQMGEWVIVPKTPTIEMVNASNDLAGRVRIGNRNYHISIAWEAMLDNAPAPPLCTAEEAAELAKNVCGSDVEFMRYSMILSGGAEQLAAIINAWAKRS
jgi:hypothetical protein